MHKQSFFALEYHFGIMLMFGNLRLLLKLFTPIEEQLFAELSRLLHGSRREKLQKQIQRINKVQRILDWSEINFYSLRRGKAEWDPSTAFNNREELKIAKVQFSTDDHNFTANFHAVSGYVFSLVIRPSIKRHAFRQITAITKSELIQDPDQNTEVRLWTARLPESYIVWLDANGVRETNGWSVCSKEETYQIHLSDADYVVLAVRDGDEFLLATNGDGAIYCSDTDPPRRVSPDFATALSE